jgi:tetratricopeptide (TPR) repeat protein
MTNKKIIPKREFYGNRIIKMMSHSQNAGLRFDVSFGNGADQRSNETEVLGKPLISWFLVFAFCFISCSSAPERPAAVYTSRNMAANQLDLANRTANRGRYDDALLILDDVKRTAVSVDDPPLLIKTAITRGNIYFSTGRHNDAFAEWDYALKEAQGSGETNLEAQVKIFIIRGRLVLLIAGNPDGPPLGEIENLRSQALQALAGIRSDNLSEAAGRLVVGMADKELKNYTEAENNIRRALKIHEDGRYFEEAAYDWFLIGSVRSVAGQYDAAVDALLKAINFDRRAENGFGLASSWQALGGVYAKAGKTDESAAAYKRAAGIYRAMGFDAEALKAEAKPEKK